MEAKNINTEDKLLQDYCYSDFYLLKIRKIPQVVIDFFNKKAIDYKNNGYGYQDKDYTSYKAIQVDINANSDEDAIKYLINNDLSFVNTINDLIYTAVYVDKLVEKTSITGLYLNGNYDFNKNHGMTDHDHFISMQYEAHKTYVDLLRNDKSYNTNAAWSVEVKTSSLDSTLVPTSVHQADIVLKHILGTNLVQVFIPKATAKRSMRQDTDYLYIGTVSTADGIWADIHIDNNGNIKAW